MIEKSIIIEIEKLLDNKKIIDSKLLSDSFGINCLKIITNDSEEFIVKYYYKNNDKFITEIQNFKNFEHFPKRSNVSEHVRTHLKTSECM